MPSFRWLSRHGATHRPAFILVGLGNPGPRYAHSRHNVGFHVLERLAEKHKLQFSRRRFQSLLAEGEVAGVPVVLAKPQTYMNASGEAVDKLLASYRVEPASLFVVYDDLDLPVGKLRMRARGSAGGHHGMESIITLVHTSDFARLRVGIGRPESREDVDHVLGRFRGEEQDQIEMAFDRAAAALETALADGLEKAMSVYNRDS